MGALTREYSPWFGMTTPCPNRNLIKITRDFNAFLGLRRYIKCNTSHISKYVFCNQLIPYKKTRICDVKLMYSNKAEIYIYPAPSMHAANSFDAEMGRDKPFIDFKNNLKSKTNKKWKPWIIKRSFQCLKEELNIFMYFSQNINCARQVV